jgi:hypothetical protein
MLDQHYRGKPGGQYADAFEKLYLNGNRQKFASQLDPQWTADNAGYRSANYELGPWGVGNTIQGRNTEGAPDHLDSTMATETDILAELAKRDQQRRGRLDLEHLMSLFGR